MIKFILVVHLIVNVNAPLDPNLPHRDLDQWQFDTIADCNKAAPVVWGAVLGVNSNAAGDKAILCEPRSGLPAMTPEATYQRDFMLKVGG